MGDRNMKIYSMCNKPGGCCPEVAYDEENDMYRIFDNNAGWTTEQVSFEQLIQIRDIMNNIESEREDIKDLD